MVTGQSWLVGPHLPAGTILWWKRPEGARLSATSCVVYEEASVPLSSVQPQLQFVAH